MAASLDGRTAMADGSSKWITGPAAREDVQHWRARAGAILTGADTVLADDPMLTVRLADTEVMAPLRVVLDSRLRVRDGRGGLIAGLRVVDAGAMPTITSGNTNSPTLMMAEQAAAWIRADAATRPAFQIPASTKTKAFASG